MKGDFTRNTFNPLKHFTRVLMQQGRVQLDADWNEQTAIVLHYLQTLAADLIGPHGGPTESLGFGIVDVTELSQDERKRLTDLKLLPLDEGDFLIGKGHYYVNGILCENEEYVSYSNQIDLPSLEPLTREINVSAYLVYLDVWERHITYLEDGRVIDPNIREVALGGPDTATRAKLIRQVKVQPMQPGPAAPTRTDAEQWIREQMVLSKAHLRARARIEQASTDPCTISPDARYRGAENQLYRVEIHKSGKAGTATFKWSRENGSVVFPISNMISNKEGAVVTLKHMGRDRRFGLTEGDWVEVVDDDYVLQNRSDPLLKVKRIDSLKMQVTLDGSPASVKIEPDSNKHPLLRRWDHKGGDPRQGGLTMGKDTEGAALIVEGEGEKEGWLILEDGVQIQFPKAKLNEPNDEYRTGDYWLIPARTATGDVEWPGPVSDPAAIPPHGVIHHYAPLAVITLDASGNITETLTDCRRTFGELAK